jgi:DUF1680 family protein
MITRFRFLATVLTTTASLIADAQIPVKRFEPVSFSQVNITDRFWRPKLDKVATATLQACIFQTEEKTGRIRNFEKVQRGKHEKHEGVYYDDSDVYKALEAIAYSLKNSPDAELEKKPMSGSTRSQPPNSLTVTSIRITLWSV